MTADTIFHKIIRKEIPATIVLEDDEVLAFHDVHPKAPTHLLFIPKQFVASIADITAETASIPGMLIRKAQMFAAEKGIDGYKLTFHVGKMVTSPRPVVDQSYQVALNLIFDSKQAQDDYQVHPLHIEFVEKVFKPCCARAVIYDFE